MVISYSCNSRVFVTQVKILVLRMLHTRRLSCHFSQGDLQRRKVFYLSFGFVLVIQHQVFYHSSSVWVWNERVSVLCDCYVDQSCIRQWMRLSRSNSLWDKTSRVHLASPVTAAVPGTSKISLAYKITIHCGCSTSLCAREIGTGGFNRHS
jgi:hypothetical protein